MPKLVDLKRQQRPGDHHCHPLSPPFQAPEADALQQEQGRVKESDCPQLVQSSWSDIRSSRQGLGDEVVARIEVIPDYKSVHVLRDVFVDKAESTDTGRNEQRSFYELEDCDRAKQQPAFGRLWHLWERGILTSGEHQPRR